MSGIAAVFTSICVSAIIGGVFFMLLPEYGSNRVMKTVIGVFMLGCTILPLLGIDYEKIDFRYDEASNFSEELSSKINNTAEKLVSAMLQKKISEKGIKADVSANARNDFNSGIIVSHVCIYINKSDADKINELERTVQSECGKETSVEFVFNSAAEKQPEQ